MTSESRPGALARVFRVVKTVVTASVALAALALFLAWMGGAFHAKVPPGSVAVERPSAAGRTLVVAEKTAGPEVISVVGSVQPRQKTDVASQLLAAIREIKPRPGDRVRAGEVIVTLDDRELVAQQREATAVLAASEADLVTRRSDFERSKSLRSTGAIGAEEAARIEGALRIAEAQVRRAKESIARVEVHLTYTSIASSTDGVVTDRSADPGDIATPGKPLLTVYDPSDLELHANVPETLAAGITLGQSLVIRIDANNFTTQATVREIVPLAQQASRSVVVKLALPVVSSNPLLPGMFGRVTIPVGQSERVWVLKAAVYRLGQLDLVEVATADGTLTRRFVRVGREVDDRVEIQTGLAAGERVALPAK
jgi:RND family efflux transporter MFP subunit